MKVEARVEGMPEARNLGRVTAEVAAHVVRANSIEGCIVISINQGTADIGCAGHYFALFANDTLRQCHRIMAECVQDYERKHGPLLERKKGELT